MTTKEAPPCILQLPKKMKRIFTTKARIIVLVGGRSSGKTEGVGRLLLMKAVAECADILCGREFQASIDDSVHKLLSGLIVSEGIMGAEITDKKIDFYNGAGIRYKGFARNSSAVRSAQGFKYSWIDEAQFLSQASIDDLLPTIRKGEKSQLFFTANLMASNDPFSKRFVVPFKRELDKHGIYEDDLHLVIMMNWRDNPWHDESGLEKLRLHDKKTMSRAKYDHIWEGHFNDTVEDAIIQAEWFDAAIDAHIKLGWKAQGAKVVAHDPSDTGPDPKGLCYRHGSVIMDVREKDDGDSNDGCDWATSYAISHGADLFVWDCDGMGVSLKRQVTDAFDGKKIDAVMFKGSEGVINPSELYQPDDRIERYKAKTNRETFRNKRAQYYWMLRDKFYNTYRAVVKKEYVNPDDMISISSNIECLTQFRSEVCRIPLKSNPNGFLQIMTKLEMKLKLKIVSPNLADSAMMCMEIPEIMQKVDNTPITIPNLRNSFPSRRQK